MTNKKLLFYRIISVLLLVGIMVLIFYLSSENADESKDTSDSVVSFLQKIIGDIPDGVVRTVAHGCEFALLGFLSANVFFAFKSRVYTAAPIVLSVLYAISDEVHQLFVPGRAFQITDILVDTIGILLGIFAFWLLITFINRTKKLPANNNPKTE